MTTKQQVQLKTVGSLLSIVATLVIAVSAILAIKYDAKAAITKAADARKDVLRLEAKLEKTETLAEQNARDFAYFKGEVNAKLDFIITNMKQQYDLIQSWEPGDGKK